MFDKTVQGSGFALFFRFDPNPAIVFWAGVSEYQATQLQMASPPPRPLAAIRLSLT